MISDKTEMPKTLIPSEPRPTESYFCTWGLQSDVASKLGITGESCSELRDALTTQTLFGEENYYHCVEKEFRGSLYFMLDDGWDVPFGTKNVRGNGREFFGSIDPDPKKFAELGDTPEERLKGLSEKVKELGYAGLGLWIAAQQTNETGESTSQTARKYWEERAIWCHKAGITYWKVDWGDHSRDIEYRRMMTEVVRQYAPGLIIEHAIPQQPYDTINGEEFVKNRRINTEQLLPISDVFRLYDVHKPFQEVALLARADEVFSCDVKREYDVLGLVNAEIEPYVAGALGCTVGIMKHSTEMRALLNWQKISPPFGIFECGYKKSDDRLYDKLYFENDIIFMSTAGKEIVESAPAIMARGCDLPKVTACGEIVPFVAASKNPRTGAYALAAFRRNIDPNRNVWGLADVELKIDEKEPIIGVFGIFNSVRLVFDGNLGQNITVMAQDLAGCGDAVDITEKIIVEGNTITLDGRLLRSFGKQNRGNGDESIPATVLKLIKRC